MRWVRAAAMLAGLCAAIPVGGAAAGPNGIKIGVLTDMVGTFGDISGMGSAVAARMAVEDSGGTALGRPIEVVVADHQNKPDIANTIARRWLDVEGVDLIVDVPNSGILLALQEVVRGKSGLLIAAAGGTSRFTDEACSPYGFQWVYDSYALANSVGRAVTGEGARTWFFLPADYAWGEAMSADLSRAVTRGGGRVVGAVKTPLGAPDFSSFLLQAQASRADVVALLSAGTDTVNAVKQAREFGLTEGRQKLAGLLVFITDVNALGLQAAQGLQVTTSFYWDRDEKARAWTKRFLAAGDGRVPTMIHAGVYSAVTHYLKGVAAAGSSDRDAIAAKMRALPVEDAVVKGGRVREDGIMLHDILLLQVKTPAESKGEWDLFTVLKRTPGEQAFRPVADSRCPLLRKG